MRIAFLGLGAMGRALVERLLAAGHDVTVWNRSRGPVDELVAKGAHAASSPADAARADVVCSMLADDRALAAVWLDGGALAAMARGSIHVNHATISVGFARELIARHRDGGIGYVAAPVFGRPESIAKGSLNVLAAGVASDVARVLPLLEALGKKVWRVGEEPTRANVIKVAGNFMIAAAIEAMGEASALVRAHGVSGNEFLAMMGETLFACPVYQGYGAAIADERYSPAGFALRLGYKDARLALAAGDDAHVPLPLAALVRDGFLDALAHGDGELDWAALAEVAARHAHLDRRAKK